MKKGRHEEEEFDENNLFSMAESGFDDEEENNQSFEEEDNINFEDEDEVKDLTARDMSEDEDDEDEDEAILR